MVRIFSYLNLLQALLGVEQELTRSHDSSPPRRQATTATFDILCPPIHPRVSLLPLGFETRLRGFSFRFRHGTPPVRSIYEAKIYISFSFWVAFVSTYCDGPQEPSQEPTTSREAPTLPKLNKIIPD